jgi:hypothetical protein
MTTYYDRASHQVRFTAVFTHIEVVARTTDAIVATFDLQDKQRSVQIQAIDDDYQISYTAPLSNKTTQLNIGGISTLAITGARLGGIGIVDLEDMKQRKPTHMEFFIDLECTPAQLAYKNGPLPLKVGLADRTCFVYRAL